MEGATSAASAVLVALLSAAVFWDIHFLTAATDIVILSACVVAVAVALHAAYAKAASAALARATERNRGRAAQFAKEAGYFAIFQTNFFYFIAFALMAYVVLPQFEGVSHFGLIHAAFSMVPSALLVSLSGRTSLF